MSLASRNFSGSNMNFTNQNHAHLEKILQNLAKKTVVTSQSPPSTGKSLSEALIFASTNPQYDKRLFIELQVQYMKIPSSNLGRTYYIQKLFLTF